MQQAALLEAMVGDVLVLVADHRPAREQRVAVLSVAREGIGAVDGFVTFGGQVLGLRHMGPTLEVAGLLAVHPAHLLQADDVCIELLDRQAQIVDLQPARGAQPLHTLVDVVGRYAQDAGMLGRQFDRCCGHRPTNRGSQSMASALEGE